MIQPRGNRVLIQRVEEPAFIVLTDAPKSIKGVILAVGPKVTDVKPGMSVLFNSKWNDFSAGENVGTGADGLGPLTRPLPLGADPKLHLVTEGDIFGIIPSLSVKATLLPPLLEREHMQTVETKGPWNGGDGPKELQMVNGANA
jgi:hypothetical protein